MNDREPPNSANWLPKYKDRGRLKLTRAGIWAILSHSAMRSISIFFLSFFLTLSAYGCFSSRDRGKDGGSGYDEMGTAIETGGIGSKDIPASGSGGRGSVSVGVGGGIVRPFDAAIIDVVVAQGGNGGIGGTGGIDIDDDAGMSDAPCVPNCPNLEWVTIPGGTFMMGSPEGIVIIITNIGQPQHEVTVPTFKISKTEITVQQYGVCVDARICSEPSTAYETDNWGKAGRENNPINSVNWYQAREFAEWLDGRLPSEAEWEYAARSGGQDIVYPWGNEEVICERAVIDSDENGNSCGNATTLQVCSKPLGNTAQGLCDMAGNVREWVEDDWHQSYSGAPSDGRAWIDSPRFDSRVLRGGSWVSLPHYCRSASRGAMGGYPDDSGDTRGFRVVLDVE